MFQLYFQFVKLQLMLVKCERKETIIFLKIVSIRNLIKIESIIFLKWLIGTIVIAKKRGKMAESFGKNNWITKTNKEFLLTQSLFYILDVFYPIKFETWYTFVICFCLFFMFSFGMHEIFDGLLFLQNVNLMFLHFICNYTYVHFYL